MNKKPITILVLTLLTLGFVGLDHAEAASATVTVAPMEAHPADPREPRKRDKSILVRSDTGITAEVRTSNLDEGTYTLWWVIFNNPEFCFSLPCSADDLPANGGDERVEVSVIYADGRKVTSSGRGRFIAGLAVEETKDAAFGPGLLDPRGAEVHLVVRTHGPEILELLHEQISTPAGGCPPNSCPDQQFSIQLP